MAGEPRSDAGRRRRWSGLLAVVIGLTYITWRAYDTLTGVPPWLAVSALVVEAAGVAGTITLLAALRRPRRSRRADAIFELATDEGLGPVDVVVRFDGQSLGHLHATLAGARYMFDVRRIAVVTDRVELTTNAVRGTGVTVLPAEAGDSTRLRAALTFGEAPFIAVFDAGDVPQPGFTGALRGAFTDADVAVVQGNLTPDGVDSAEHDARGRHELRFERDALNPSLGERGGAVFAGSGAMIRRSALHDIAVPRGARRSAELRWSIRLRASGHSLLAPARPIVSAASINTERAVLAERRRAVRATTATLLSRHSPLWTLHLGGSHRVGYLAWMVRPLSGLRRLAFIAVLLACVVSGSSPVNPQSSAWIVGGLWAAWFVTQGWAARRCSGGALHPGDRTRWSLRTMGASVAALFGAGRRAIGDSIDAARTGGWRGAGRNPMLMLSLLAVAVASVAIGVDRWTPVLREADPWVRASTAAAAVWVIALMLDVMRCLVGGPQLRAAQRLRVRLDAMVDESAARLTNLSPRGAGVRFDGDPDLIVGDQVAMRFLVPTGSGTTAEVATIATVRSIRLDDSERSNRNAAVACGVEFGTMDRISADALFAYCAVVHPGRLADSTPSEQRHDDELIVGALPQRRFVGARLVGAVALLGIGSAMMPPFGVTSAAPPSDGLTIVVRLVDVTSEKGVGVEGATIIATCVAGTRVIDDHDEVTDMARAAVKQTRDKQRASARAAAAALADRNVRRENLATKQAAQAERLAEAEKAMVEAALATSASPADAVGWHPVPAVESVDGEPIVATDRGDGTYVLTGLPGAPCRVEAVDLPKGFVAAPAARSGGALVQFADGDQTVLMGVQTEAPSVVEIGNRVWLDDDGDGLQDPAEPGLAGVEVTMTVDGKDHSVLTDDDGEYLFTSDPKAADGLGVASVDELRVGASVQIAVPPTVERKPSSFHLTVAGALSGDLPATSIDSSVDPAKGIVTFTVEPDGTVEHDIDIGYTQAHALGDRVWLDADNDGLMGSDELGVDGVTVLLYVDQKGDGIPDGGPVAAQVTSKDGGYAFGGLPAGRYIVEVHPPAGMVSSTGAIGRLDGPYEPPIGKELTFETGVDGDDDGRMLSTGVIRSSTISLGDDKSPDVRGDATVDFGIFAARAIDDAVWLDQNADGRLSADEPGLAGVPLVLLRGEQVLAMTETDTEGDFVFPNLTLGDYTVQVHAPAGLRPLSTLPVQTDDGELPGEPETTPADTDETSNDAAADTVPSDEPVDPTLDGLDGTVDGVINVIIESPDATDPPTTDPDEEAPELPIEATAPKPGDDPEFEVINVSIAPDWAGPDSERALQRFGLWAPRSIGHMVWEDADDDGIRDPDEVGIPGVHVSLLEGDRVVGRTVSAVDGTYRFVDLPDGTYRVAVDVPVTWRTSTVGWDDPTSPTMRIDHGLATHATGRAVSQPIHLDRVEVDASGSFERADIGLFQPRPAVQLSTSVRDGAAPTAGSTVRFDAIVTNAGNVPLSELVVTDDLAASGDLDCNGSADGDGQPLLLDVGRSVTCTTSARVTGGAGQRTVTVGAIAESSPNKSVALDAVTDVTRWVATAPGLALRTFATPLRPGTDVDADGVLDAGAAPTLGPIDDADQPGGADPTVNRVVSVDTPMWWVYDVQNTGDTTLVDVAVVDPQRGQVCRGLVLAPGEHRLCVASAPHDAGQQRSTGSATAVDFTDPTTRVTLGPVTDSAHFFVARSELQVAALIDGSPAPPAPGAPVSGIAGDVVDLSYDVTNTGDIAFEWVALADSTTGLVDCPELSVGRGGLEPGETVTCNISRRLDGPPTSGEPTGTSVAQAPTQTNVRVEGQPVDLAEVSTETAPSTVIAESSWSYLASTADVAGEAFVDSDADAARSADERTMAAVDVHLLDPQGQTLATSTTDADGRWQFSSVVPGLHAVEYVVPDGYVVAMNTVDGVRVVAPGPDRTFVTDEALIGAETERPAWGLALVKPVGVRDVAWIDVDGDGRRGIDEPVAAGVEVELSDASGATIARTLTDSLGAWSFDGLTPGRYRVTIGAVTVVVQLSGSSWTSAPIGVTPLSRIEDRVWQQPEVAVVGQPSTTTGMRNVVVSLVDASAPVAVPVAVTTTDNIGRFAFDGVPAGDYVVALGAVAAGSPVADLSTSTATAAAPIVVGAAPLLRPDLSLTVTPEIRARVAPGRIVIEERSVLDPAGWVPRTGAEIVQAIVFVASLLVFSLVIATTRRRRLR